MRKILMISMLVLSGCSLNGEIKTDYLINHYYTGRSVDAELGLYFDDPQLGMTYLEFAIVAGANKGYVVACGDSCYIFPVAATAVEAARSSHLVFSTEAACKQKFFQLTGDSIKFESLL